ncbi:MAG: TerD family protein [Candidatus Sericytochromatia bacterium]
MYLTRGQRIKLVDYTKSTNFIIKIKLQGNNKEEYDISCFGLDSEEKCSDDKYMVFYNQKKTPCNSIIIKEEYFDNELSFEININKLPEKIQKISFTATVDGIGVMSDLKEGSISLIENFENKFTYKFTGNDFKNEKSLMLGEIYFKDEWKFYAKGFGFNGGLSSLLEYFGIEEEQEITSNIEIINLNSIVEEEPPLPKKNLGEFFKNILLTPFKYVEKKIDEKKELQERQNLEESIIQKKLKFKQILIDYLSDGVLTNTEMNNLEVFCIENNINIDECLYSSKYEVESFLRLLLANIVSDFIVTQEEENTIKSVCSFLKPSIQIIEEIESTIYRVKELSKIRKGEVYPIDNPKIITKLSELVWYIEYNIKILKITKKDLIHYKGDLFVTSDRLLFKSQDYPLEISLKNIIDLEYSGLDLYITGNTNKSTCQFKLYEGEKLLAYIEQALNKFHRKLDFSNSNKKTRTIPQTVRQEVWLRDQGQCVECLATEYLEYDHVIPFSKGGSNSTNNIQLLCRKCNLKKSDRI